MSTEIGTLTRIPVEVSVEQADIDGATPGLPLKCPITAAATRAGLTGVVVGTDWLRFVRPDGRVRSVRLSDELQGWIAAYDKGHKVNPLRFNFAHYSISWSAP